MRRTKEDVVKFVHIVLNIFDLIYKYIFFKDILIFCIII